MTSVPKPLTSVEVRWFISAADPPDALGDWIAADWSADSKRSPNEETRTDSYLVTADAGVGAKRRDQRQLEVKYSREAGQTRDFGRHEGRIERWMKWSVDNLEAAALPRDVVSKVQEARVRIDVRKTRWLRRLAIDAGAPIRELPPDQWVDRAVGVELTRIVAREQQWWSIGFEAFPDDETVGRAFAPTVTRVLDPLRAIKLTLSSSMGYPEWLIRMLNAGC